MKIFDVFFSGFMLIALVFTIGANLDSCNTEILKQRNASVTNTHGNNNSPNTNRTAILSICGTGDDLTQNQIQSLLNNGFVFRGTLNNPISDCTNLLFVKP